MARIAGRKGRIYIDVPGGGAATPLPFVATWSLSAQTATLDVTAMEDSNKTYVADTPDSSGDMSGFYDDATAQTYTAASDGIARKFYIYPSTANSSQYWFGTAFFDFQVSSGVGEAAKIQAKWSAATPVSKVG